MKRFVKFLALSWVAAVVAGSGAVSAITVSDISPSSGPIQGGTAVEFTADAEARFVQVTAGDSFSVGLTADGKLYSWGINYNGELGNGTTGGNSVVPAPVYTEGELADKRIIQISSGGVHTLALDEDGQIYAWGSSHFGQLGDGTNNNHNRPVSIEIADLSANEKVIEVSAGHFFSAALTNEGNVYTWGDGEQGQLGNGLMVNSSSPVKVDTSGVLAGKQIVDISAGEAFVLALSSEGKLYSWGHNWGGQLGDGTIGAGADKSVPVEVNSTFNNEVIKQISTGWQHGAALTEQGSLWVWGGNWSGQIGDGTNINRNLPVKIGGAMTDVDIKFIELGSDYSVVGTSDGEVYHWGYSIGVIDSPSPILYATGLTEGFKSIAVGAYNHTTGISDDGLAYGWGLNNEGQVGDGTTDIRSLPTLIDMSEVALPLPTVYFGTIKAEQVERIDNNRYRVITPAGVLGTFDISITFPGVSPVVLSDAFTYTATPIENTLEENEGVNEGETAPTDYDDQLANTGVNYYVFTIGAVVVTALALGARLYIRS